MSTIIEGAGPQKPVKKEAKKKPSVPPTPTLPKPKPVLAAPVAKPPVTSPVAAAPSAPAATASEQVPSTMGQRGNWLRKRELVKQADAVNAQLQKDVLAVQKARGAFTPEFEAIDKKVGDFYSVKGFARGKALALIDELRAEITQDKEQRIASAKEKSERDDVPLNYYDVQLEAIEDDVKRLSRELDQFNLDMKAIADLDAALSERLKVVDKHIKDANDQAAQSSGKLDEMWWLIDDRIARDRFYEIQQCADRVASIKTYLETTLLNDFKKTAQTLEKQMEQVQKQVDALEQRGIIVEHRERRLAQKKVMQEREEQETREREEMDAAVEVAPRRVKKEASWYAWLMASVGALKAVGEWVMSLVGMGSKAPAAARRRRAVTAEVEEPEVVHAEEHEEQPLEGDQSHFDE